MPEAVATPTRLCEVSIARLSWGQKATSSGMGWVKKSLSLIASPKWVGMVILVTMGTWGMMKITTLRSCREGDECMRRQRA